MPELPEVECVRRGLESLLSERPRIVRFEFFRGDLRRKIPVRQLRKMEGFSITGVERRSKYLLFRTEAGSMLSHLGMTGSWRIVKRGEELPHDHVYLHLDDGSRLGYRDPRRFGLLDFVPPGQSAPDFAGLGPEPLSEDFDLSGFGQALKGTDRAVKLVLMDPRVVVGVGNIYASEALFRSGVRPSKRASRLGREELGRLYDNVRQILKEAIDAGGSSISDYVQADGANGRFQERFRVYDREGLPCVNCRSSIRRTVLGGRGTFHCPKCQR